ncbi:MAG: 3-phosphoglycerate dehydrogenase [Hyphomicrobiales bacterium]|nr:3-phosphoglycerate dehydrogenase [Hyphomicrobiales bacterium]
MSTILLVGDIHADGHALLRSRSDCETILLADPRPQDVLDAARTADAIIVRKLDLRADVLEEASRLKVVSRHGVGCDNIDVAWLSARGIPVMVVGDANAQSVAEHAMLLLLAAARRLPACMNLAAHSADLDERAEFLAQRNAVGTMELADRTLLIVGYGRIGRKVAKLADAFAMRVVVADPFVDAGDVRQAGFDHVADFQEALGAADGVVLSLPATAGGPPLFGQSQFAAMKKGAVLVNVARGTLVDEDALADALQTGHLRGAGTDVWTHLPPGPDHRFFGLPGMVMTPHCAAHADACLSRMAVTSVQNAFDVLDGKPQPGLCFNPEVLKGAGHRA